MSDNTTPDVTNPDITSPDFSSLDFSSLDFSSLDFSAVDVLVDRHHRRTGRPIVVGAVVAVVAAGGNVGVRPIELVDRCDVSERRRPA